SYELATGLDEPTLIHNLYIHGDEAGPMPTISSPSATTTLIGATAIGDRVAFLHLSLNGQQTGVACGDEGSVERVVVTASDEHAVGVSQRYDCLLRESLIRVDGSGSAAVHLVGAEGTWTARMRNVTAIATGAGSAGFSVSTAISIPIEPPNDTADLEN